MNWAAVLAHHASRSPERAILLDEPDCVSTFAGADVERAAGRHPRDFGDERAVGVAAEDGLAAEAVVPLVLAHPRASAGGEDLLGEVGADAGADEQPWAAALEQWLLGWGTGRSRSEAKGSARGCFTLLR